MANKPVFNPALLAMAFESYTMPKSAFVASPNSDPSSTMGGGGDPSQMPPDGTDPSAGAGAPAAPSGGSDPESMRMMMRQELMALGIGGGGAGAGGAKPMKLDVGVELHRLNVMIAHLCDALGVQLPAADMVTTEDQAQNPSQGGASAGGQPPGSAIPPIQPIAPAGPGMSAMGQNGQQKTSQDQQDMIDMGEAVDTKGSLLTLSNKAQATSLLYSKIGQLVG